MSLRSLNRRTRLERAADRPAERVLVAVCVLVLAGYGLLELALEVLS